MAQLDILRLVNEKARRRQGAEHAGIWVGVFLGALLQRLEKAVDCLRLRSSGIVNPEVAFDQAHFSHDAILVLPGLGLPLFEGVHNLKALQGGVGGFHRFEPGRWLDQSFELAVIGLDDVVQILYLPVLHVLQALALGLQFGDGRTVGRRLVGIDLEGVFLIFQPLERLAEKALGGLCVARRRKIEIDPAPELVDGTIKINPFAADPHVGFIASP